MICTELQRKPTQTMGSDDDVVFRAILTPNRSLSRQGFIVLMGAICVVSFAVGLAFFVAGAWPVVGFLGLDILLIYWAFSANYRSGQGFETVEVAPRTLKLTRSGLDSRPQAFEFQTYWVRILLHEEPCGHTRLHLRSHGRSLPIARFLSDDERRVFASTLETEIRVALGGRRG
ncbi:MAG: DUF2244 domain-containing protein [Hyphomicrobiaceae bacterium]